jgi:polar amino acid transport system permease protein
MIADWFKALYDARGINFSVFYDRGDALTFISGLWTTVELSLGCILLSVVIGAIGAWLQQSRWPAARAIVRAYVALFRNTPPLAQLYFLYFGVGSLMMLVPNGTGGMRPLFDNFTWAMVAMSLFAGAFNAEIFRAGLEAVPRTTIDAAEALGYSPARAYWYVVLPLAFRISLPALNNNLVTLVKGTTVAYAIGVPELLTAASTIWGASVNIPEMMIVLLATFLALVGGLVSVLHRIEAALRIPGYVR